MEKLTTLAQVASLQEGAIIKRFPANGDYTPRDIFDEKRVKNIDTFTVRSINPQTQMLLLISAHEAHDTFASAVTVGRLFIKSDDLLTEKVWWV